MIDLKDRRVVVTGISAGIGQGAAVTFARAGADVAGIYRSGDDGAAATERAIRELGRDALIVKGDTGVRADVDALAEAVVERWGGIDVWVNNAARLIVRPVVELSDEDWHGYLATNLHGYFYGCRAAARQMMEQRSGTIINVTSISDFQPIAELGAYIAPKGAIVALTQVLALELAPYGVTVNALAPGATDTPLNQEAYTPEVRANYEARIALGRIASVEEIAEPIVMLASPAFRYMTGHELLVDGGMVINGSVGHARS